MRNWEIRKIGDVCKVIAGQSPEGKYYNSDGNGLAFYQGKKEYGEKYIGEPTTWTTVITKEAEAYDILMSVRAPVGPINFATQKICIGRGLAAIRASKLIDKEFLFNFLLKHESEIVGNSGAVFNSINKAQIEAIEIPLPPLPEQQRIVAILDEAFAAIAKAKANAQQNLQNAKELFESYLQGVFENKMSESGFLGLKDEQDLDNKKSKKEILKSSNLANPDSDKGEGWEEKTLGEMIEIKNGKNQQAVLSATGQYKVMGSAGNVMGYAIDFICEAGTTIIGRKGNISKPIYIEERFWNVDTAFGFFPKNENDIDKRFVYYLCLGIDFKSMNRGTTIPSLVKSELQTIQIAFPKSLKTQQTIVQKLDALNAETKKLESIYQQKIKDLEELKKSVLQKAFSGELKTVRGEV
jgi:type I restriction enzyme S subunit